MQGWPISGIWRRSISHTVIRSPMKVFDIFRIWYGTVVVELPKRHLNVNKTSWCVKTVSSLGGECAAWQSFESTQVSTREESWQSRHQVTGNSEEVLFGPDEMLWSLQGDLRQSCRTAETRTKGNFLSRIELVSQRTRERQQPSLLSLWPASILTLVGERRWDQTN
jgi:hypothetical protein